MKKHYQKNEILLNRKKSMESHTQNKNYILALQNEVELSALSEMPYELINIYTKRINQASEALSIKIEKKDIRPFEFLVNRN